eukprot:gene2789-18633_t
MAEGAGEGERRGRRERQFAERMAMERLYLEMMPTVLRDGVTLRDFLAAKNNALQSLTQSHKEEHKVAVDACYLKKKETGKRGMHYNLNSGLMSQTLVSTVPNTSNLSTVPNTSNLSTVPNPNNQGERKK